MSKPAFPTAMKKMEIIQSLKKEEDSASFKQYNRTQRRWDAFASQYADQSRLMEFVDGNGRILDQAYATFTRFAQFLDQQSDMTYSNWSNSLNWLQKQLQHQLAMHGMPNIKGLIRSLHEIQTLNKKWNGLRNAPVAMKSDGEFVFKDIQSHLENDMSEEQTIKAVMLLLNAHKDLKMGELYCLSTLVEMRGSFMQLSRSDDSRSEMMCYNFLRRVENVGHSGVDAACVLSNGGKTNSSGRLEYVGTVAHLNAILDYAAAKGHLFAYRFGMAGEPVPDFLDQKDFFLRPTLRQAVNYRKTVTYDTQRRCWKRLYELIDFVSVAGMKS